MYNMVVLKKNLKCFHHLGHKALYNSFQIANVVQRLPWKSLLGNCVVIKDVVMFHNVQGMPFNKPTHNFMQNMVYLTEASHRKWVHKKFWQDMLNHKCIHQRREKTFKVFNGFFMVMGTFWGYGLGYKTQLLKFVEVSKGLWFLEIKQGVLFLVLEVQSFIISRFFQPPTN